MQQGIPWADGRWTHEPVTTSPDGDHLLVEAKEGSDAWRTTSYGFIHDDEHALLAPLATATRSPSEPPWSVNR